MEDLALLDRAHAQVRYNPALRLEIVGMLTGALADEYYWTDRVSLIPDFTYALLEEATSKGLPNVIFIEGINIGKLPIRDVADRITTHRSAPLTTLYNRVDLNRKDRVYVGYEDNHGAFVPDGEGQAGQGGHTDENCWSTRRPYQTLWGRLAQVRFAVGGLTGRRTRKPFD